MTQNDIDMSISDLDPDLVAIREIWEYNQRQWRREQRRDRIVTFAMAVLLWLAVVAIWSEFLLRLTD